MMDKVTALNAHFAGRGINFVYKTGAQDRCLDKIVIEVASRQQTAAAIPAHVLAAGASQPFQTIDHLPPHAIAIPMQTYAPVPAYGYAN